MCLRKTPGRLPKTVIPQRYEVRIDPSIEKAVFSGEETIALEVRDTVREIVLHSSGLEITNARLLAAKEIALTPKLNAKSRR